MLNITLTSTPPKYPGTYFMRLPSRNTRLADVTNLAGSLMVYCLDVNIRKWIDHMPEGTLWSEVSVKIEGDTRLN